MKKILYILLFALCAPVLFAASGGVTAVLTPAAAASLLVFSLLYSPCIAAIAAVKRELGAKWAVYMVLWQCFIAWVFTFLVRMICTIWL